MANQKGGNTATSETGTGTSAARSSGTSRGSGRKAGARQGGRKNAAKGSAGTTGGTQLRGAAAGKSNDPIQLLKADHQRVNQLFTEFESAEDNQKQQLVRQICQELVIHAMLEEQLFYPACRDAIEDEELLNRAQVEHDSAKLLIGDLMSGRGDRSFRDAKVKVLAEQVRHHVQEEEQPRRGILAQAKAAGVATPELAAQMQELKQSLMERGEALPNPQPISFQPTMSNQFREVTMARNDYNDRDDRGGRYGMSEGRGGGGGGYRSAGGRDDDDRGHGRGGWFGDPEGHSEAARRGWETREEEERGGRSYGGSRGGYSEGRGGGGYSSRGYGRDDDDGRGQGRGGWFGDPEGHSEAARRGWESREDDDRGGRSYGSTRGGYGGGRGRDDDEGPGWHGDPRGHSEAARRGWETRRREEGYGGGGYSEGRGGGGYSSRGGRDDDGPGWHGDPRGHSEAARLGWERRRDEDDDRGGRSSGSTRGGYQSRGGRDDDDGRGHGEGGWFGDSRGHSEAARRGWENRHEDDDRGGRGGSRSHSGGGGRSGYRD